MEQKFYICSHCGNVITKLTDKGVPVMCCGEVMKEISAGSVDASKEKHVPVVKIDNTKVYVSVGSVEHPMEKAHYIEWICLETEHVIQYAHLNPTDEPRAKFALCEGDEVRAVCAFCNQHSLWRK